MQDSPRATKQAVLSLLDRMLEQGVLESSDLGRYVTRLDDSHNPEFVRRDLEQWYINLGIETITGQKCRLSPCPFTREEIAEVHENHEIILCVPKGVTRQELGQLFRIDSWVLYDPLVTPATEKEDFWFKTSSSLKPGYLNKTGMEIKHLFEDEKKLHFSIERYLTFIARVRHLTNHTPDLEYWIWLPRGAYDRSGMLVAGFDRNHSFNAHGWMPQFSASFVGARYGIRPNATARR